MKTLIGRLRGDRGSAVVEFALVTPLLLLVALAVLQVTLALHVRATLTAAAAEGARAGALAGSGLRVAEARTREVLADALGGSAASDIAASRVRLDGVEVIRVRVTSSLPLLGTLGPTALTIEGHAMTERL
ncbi:MAG: TadE/TadG family type IV pilus assembly protein [Candidatus Nanopelagicales bacterium]